MSSAVSAARKRRAGALPAEPVRNVPTTPPNIPASAPKAGLTLPEVIALVDRRLVTLEKFMNESKSQESSPKIKFEVDEGEPAEPVLNDEIIDEFNSRFVILTEELNKLKDIILSLQSYTMSVNKVLMEERIQFISDLGNDGEEAEPEEEGEPVQEGDVQVDGDVLLNDNVEGEIDENGMTKFGIPIPEMIPRIPSKSVKFA